jgi:sn-glycerol 3-phosphate transport system ATP-binding protein
MAEIQLIGVKKSYANGFVALHKIDLKIADRQFLVVVGPSGCGKSTLLRLIAGLETLTEGRIMIGDRDVSRLEPAQRDIAMVFQNYALYPHMNVYNNLAYGLRNRKVAAAEIDRRVRDAARTLGLDQMLKRSPRELSGGQRQRVAMGRAIVRSPRAFLFDEPLSNLDAKLRDQMRGEIKRLQRNLGTTGVYVTHDQAEAMTMGDQLVVLRDGRVEQIGDPLSVYRRPATAFVARFIGSPSMNLLKGCVESGGRRARVGDTITIDLPGSGLPEQDGRTILIGIRPEHVRIDTAAPLIEVPVEMVEPLGAKTLVYVRLDKDVVTISADAGDAIQINPGDRVPFALAPDQIHLFDCDSDARIECRSG